MLSSIDYILERSKLGSLEYYYTDREVLRKFKYFRIVSAIVELVEDPDNLGRIKARVASIHGEQSNTLNNISTEDLPWCTPSSPITSSGLNIGDNIFIMFADGDTSRPVYLASGGRVGKAIEDLYVDSNGHLIVEFSDGTSTDAGYVVGPPGEKGNKGEKGDPGDSGLSYYVYIKWSSVMPTQDSDLKDTPDKYIGIYNGLSSTPPTSYTSYLWYQYKGDKGDKGNDGTEGPQGEVGPSGVYYGTDDPAPDIKVWIDPSGEPSLTLVPSGGTGRQTITSGSYLIGNGTSAINEKTPAQVLSDIGAVSITDYEEGSWTPLFRGMTTAGSFNYGERYGYYYRMNKFLHLCLRVSISSVETAPEGDLEIVNLPFPVKSVTGYRANGALWTVNVDWGTNRTYFITYMTNSANNIRLVGTQNNAGYTVIPATNIKAGSYVSFSIDYLIN
jgi:hypothetical protein